MKSIKFVLIIIFFVLYLNPAFAAGSSPVGMSFKGADAWQESQNLKSNLKGYEVTNCFPGCNWWTQFNDPILTSYIEEAIRANSDIKIALARIEESRAVARSIMGREFPQIAINGIFSRIKSPSSFLAPILADSPLASDTERRASNLYLVPITAQYELDYLLKNRDRTRSAQKEANAIQYDYQNVLISLTSEIATVYLNLLRADKLAQLNTELLYYLQSNLVLTQSLFKEGEIAFDTILVNQQAISQVKFNIAEFQKVQAVSVHQLSILMGKTPVEQSCLPRSDFDSISFNKEIILGNPCDLVSRRPDILAAEERLQKAGIDVTIARKELFPAIKITGIFGFGSSQIGNLFNWSSALAAIAANVAQSLFTGGTKIANLKAAKARCKVVLEQYHKVILIAFKEVEDSIIKLNSDFVQYNEVNKQVLDAQCLLSLTNFRFNEGEDSAFDLITAQQQLNNYKQALVQSKSNLLIDNISLHKALGGGF